jgi:hypothetical protein
MGALAPRLPGTVNLLTETLTLITTLILRKQYARRQPMQLGCQCDLCEAEGCASSQVRDGDRGGAEHEGIAFHFTRFNLVRLVPTSLLQSDTHMYL